MFVPLRSMCLDQETVPVVSLGPSTPPATTGITLDGLVCIDEPQFRGSVRESRIRGDYNVIVGRLRGPCNRVPHRPPVAKKSIADPSQMSAREPARQTDHGSPTSSDCERTFSRLRDYVPSQPPDALILCQHHCPAVLTTSAKEKNVRKRER